MNIFCIYSNRNEKAKSIKDILNKKYNNQIVLINDLLDIKTYSKKYNEINKIIVLGGDGFMIRVIHNILKFNLKLEIYGINCGNLGFLMNNLEEDDFLNTDLIEMINIAEKINLNPLEINLKTKNNINHKIFSINEISILRQTYQSINIDVFINNILEISELGGDGILIASASGSAAYNRSAGGIIIPIESKMVCLTAINPFKPRSWKAAILPDSTNFNLKIKNFNERPALACADFSEYYFVEEVQASINKSIEYTLLFNKNFHIEKKVMKEQFYLCK